jgi:DNA (cytosine-5)-methyltransferase 1
MPSQAVYRIPTGPDSEERPVPARGRPPVLSFFTGAGFLDLGFLQAGFDIIWCNEYSQSFARSFRYAFERLDHRVRHEPIVNASSIVDLGPNDICREAFGNTPKPEVFGVIGGPPCPDFSVGGKNRGRQGMQGFLTEVYVNRIIELQPTFFVLENVPGLVRINKHREFLYGLLQRLSPHYLTDFRILNALEFGVPQDRQRLFVVGFARRWLRRHTCSERFALGESWFPWPVPGEYASAKTKFPWPGRTALGAQVEKPHGVPEELTVGPLLCDYERTSRLPNGTEHFRPRSKRFWEIEEGDDSKKSFKRLHRWRYSPTAAYGNNEVHLHPTLPRRLTVREALRIQTVPDDYALPPDMPLSHKFKTIGNGVPVRLAQSVAKAVLAYIGGLERGHI